MNGWWCHIRSQALIGESAFSTDTDRLLVRGHRAEIANWKKDSFPESLLSSTLKIASSTELMAANEETSAQLKVPGTSLVPSPWFLCLMSSTFLAEHLVVAPWEKAFQPFPRRQSRQTPQEVTFGAPEPSRIWENLGSPRSVILYRTPLRLLSDFVFHNSRLRRTKRSKSWASQIEPMKLSWRQKLNLDPSSVYPIDFQYVLVSMFPHMLR